MRFTLAILLLTAVMACQEKEVIKPAQDLPEDIQGLEQLLNSSVEDQTKLEIHWRLYKLYKKTDPKRAVTILKTLGEIAKKCDSDIYQAKAHHGLGIIHKHEGEYITAVDEFLTAIDFFTKAESPSHIADDLNNLGSVFTETGNFVYAIKFFTKAKEVYAETNDLPYLVLTNINLGISNFSKVEPDYQAANDYFQEGLRLSHELKEDQDYYFNWIYTQIGIMNHRKGEYDAAVENYLRSLQHIGPSKNVEEQRAIGYANIGETFMGKGDYAEARKWLEKAFDLSTHIEDSKRVVAIYNIIGELAHLEGEVQKGTDIFEKAITLADKGIINPALQETLKLIRVSYRNLKKPVSRVRYDNVLKLDGIQDALAKEMEEDLNYKALQTALTMTIELDSERKKRVAEAERRELLGYVAWILILLAAGVAVMAYRKHRAVKKALKRNDYMMGGMIHLRDKLDRLPFQRRRV